MGLTFIFETTSGFFNMDEMGVIPKYIEIVLDSINSLQGMKLSLTIIYLCNIVQKFLLMLNCKRILNNKKKNF